MENLLIAIVSILSFLVLGLFAMIGVLIYKMFELKGNHLSESSGQSDKKNKYSSEVSDAINLAREDKELVSAQFCIDHPELFAKGICAISNKAYCELCLTKENSIKIARIHLDLLLDSKWENLFMLNSSTLSADNLNSLYQIKNKIWKDQQIPIIVHREFKINIENDKIETYLFIKVREEDKYIVSEKINFLNNEVG